MSNLTIVCIFHKTSLQLSRVGFNSFLLIFCLRIISFFTKKLPFQGNFDYHCLHFTAIMNFSAIKCKGIYHVNYNRKNVKNDITSHHLPMFRLTHHIRRLFDKYPSDFIRFYPFVHNTQNTDMFFGVNFYILRVDFIMPLC